MSRRRLVLAGPSAVAVYDDRWLPIIEALGSVVIERATDVEWDPVAREWVAIHRETRTEIARGRCRAAVIQAEVAWLESRLSAAGGES